MILLGYIPRDGIIRPMGNRWGIFYAIVCPVSSNLHVCPISGSTLLFLKWGCPAYCTDEETEAQ